MPDEFAKKSASMYYAVLRKNNVEDSVDGRFMFNRGFYLGAQYAMQISGELSPHLARFMEFVMWMTERENDEPEESPSIEADSNTIG
jgi:hypothetical protein